MMARIAPNIPAYLRCDPHVAGRRIAALTLLDRLAVAAHRAGCHPISVHCPGPRPALKRSQALGIDVEFVASPPPNRGRILVADCEFLVQARDVQAVLAANGRLATADGDLLPMGVLPGTPDAFHDALASLPAVRATGVCGWANDPTAAARVERALWRSLGSSTDGIVDTWFNRPLGRFLSYVLVHTPVTPNQVTVASALLGLAGAVKFADGTHDANVVGAILLQASALVDCVDGDIARVVFKETPIGKWLDIGLDQVVHIAVFAAIAMGLSQAGVRPPSAALGISAVAGALIAFALVVRGRRQAAREADAELERFIDAASTRDFTVLVLVLAVVDRLDWFLWLCGIGVHGFWILLLVRQLPRRVRVGTSAESARRQTT